jgi:hypothetical protein
MPVTRASLEDSLARLAVQRERYALALTSATDPRTRERHARTLERLDEEILGLREALDAVITPVERPAPARETSPWPFTETEQQGVWDGDDEPELVGPAVPRWAVAAAAVVAGTAILWIALLQ